MGLIEKALAIVMIPISVLIILEAFNVYQIALPFDKILLGAILMVLLQVFVLINMKMHDQDIRMINIITVIVFMLPGALYIINLYYPIIENNIIPILLGVMMFGEALYAMH